ncbi:MAG: RagB/SusD family nutrient uptake outer membrane protein [Cytophagales bacterium]|jgi:hypothetical protein|nr:RagB/SusD family nutrient uptake outer membrane protein [Cytophagales bacterium]
MKKYIKSLFLAMGLLGFVACNSILEVDPRQSIDSAVALEDENGIQASVIGLYNTLQSTRMYGRDLVAIPEALADNGRATNKSGRLNPEYLNQPNAHFLNWRLAYIAINQANLILEATQRVQLPEATRNSIEGQVQFLRALFYFDLMRCYAYIPGASVQQQDRGGVPLVTAGVIDFEQITLPARAPVDEVYTFIYRDLDEAITKLGATPNSRAPAFATRAAAQALYSRVALYRREWPLAIRLATEAITNSAARVVSDTAAYVAGWRRSVHPESVFELPYLIQENIGVNESLQTTYTTLRELGNRNVTAGFGDLVPTPALLADLRSENDTLVRVSTGRRDSVVIRDVRQRLYELGTTGRGTAEIECTKFLGKNGQPNLDNIPLIRISEAYLNRAEANFHAGNRAEALRDLNTIRTRCGLAARTDERLPGNALLTEILKQRRLEFAFEGHRFFDLKRQGLDLAKASPATNIPFTDFRILAPIPPREIQANPNLRQNFGY